MQLPGITINANSKIVVARLLHAPGEVLVRRGQQVEALQEVARAELPSRYQVINVAHQLARPKLDMDQVMLKAEGDSVEADEVIAVSKGGLLPFLQRAVRAPAAGYIAAIGPGWVLLETEHATSNLEAFINGAVSRVFPNRGVVIESRGAMITAACGFGGETYGPLKRLVGRNFESLQAEAIDESMKESILLGGQSVDETVLRAAEQAQVRGIIVGSIDAALMDLPVKVRVVATEGFGQIPMSPYTFGILATLSSRSVSIRGSTPALLPPIASGRQAESPVILATSPRSGSQTDYSAPPKEPAEQEIGVGSRVRVTRGSLLGASGKIDSIPSEPKATEVGLVVPGAYVTLGNTKHYIPWANLEQVN